MRDSNRVTAVKRRAVATYYNNPGPDCYFSLQYLLLVLLKLYLCMTSIELRISKLFKLYVGLIIF